VKLLIPKPGTPITLRTEWICKLCTNNTNCHAYRFFLRDKKVYNPTRRQVLEAGYDFEDEYSLHSMLVTFFANTVLFIDSYGQITKARFHRGEKMWVSCRAHLTAEYDFGKIRFQALLDNLNEVEAL
jgi:hypothetical protein